MQQYLLSVFHTDGDVMAAGDGAQAMFAAVDAYDAAIELSDNRAEREFLERRRRSLTA